MTLVTHDEGCARYPTEGNSSNHELTTTMQHLSNCLARASVSGSFQLSFRAPEEFDTPPTPDDVEMLFLDTHLVVLGLTKINERHRNSKS